MDTPIWALHEIGIDPNTLGLGDSSSCSFFSWDILKMAEGFVFDMWPRYCQEGGAFVSGQLKCTGKIEKELRGGAGRTPERGNSPPAAMPWTKGTAPVRKMTMWFTISASGMLSRNCVSPTC